MYDKDFLYDYLINFYEFSGRIIDGILDMYDYMINGNDEDFPNCTLSNIRIKVLLKQRTFIYPFNYIHLDDDQYLVLL